MSIVKTKEQKILDLLLDGKWHDTAELNRIAFRYGARLFELRRKGYQLETRRVREGLWAWRLKSKTS